MLVLCKLTLAVQVIDSLCDILCLTKCYQNGKFLFVGINVFEVKFPCYR